VTDGDGDTENGTLSIDVDDDTPTENLIFAWMLISKAATSGAFLSGADSPLAEFVADVPGDYVVSLTVTDGDGLASVADIVLVSSLNAAPTADAIQPPQAR